MHSQYRIKGSGLGHDLKKILSKNGWSAMSSYPPSTGMNFVFHPEIPIGLLTSKLENLIAEARALARTAIHPRKDIVTPTLSRNGPKRKIARPCLDGQ